MTTQDLAMRTTVADMVRTYNETALAIHAHFNALAAAEAKINTVFCNGERAIRFHIDRHSRAVEFTAPDESVEHLKREAWSAIVGKLELHRMLSIARARELDEQLLRGELPEITEANVFAFADQFYSALPEMLTEAVVEVFEWLRPREGTRADAYKRNSQLEVPSKIILTYAVEMGWGPNAKYRLQYHLDQKFTALENVLHALDGKGQVSKNYYSAVHTALGNGETETELFRLKPYKNNNLHLEFKRADLLAKFNRIAGGANLRP